MSKIPVRLLIAKAEEIAAEEPRFDPDGGMDGSRGLCDQAGLIIGAIRRAGGQWRDLHESNFIARFGVEKLYPLTVKEELSVGEVVFRAYEPGQGGYSLAGWYEPGGSCCSGDSTDYYHVGLVESVTPLRIRHMAKPRVKMDTSLDRWRFHGKLKKVEYPGESETEMIAVEKGKLEAAYTILGDILGQPGPERGKHGKSD